MASLNFSFLNLYRAKRTDNNEWVVGRKIEEDGKTYIECICSGENSTSTEIQEVRGETLCKFSGLLARFGKMIFEKDILEYHGELSWRSVMQKDDTTGTIDANIYFPEGIKPPHEYIETDSVEWRLIGNLIDDSVSLETLAEHNAKVMKKAGADNE